MSTRSPRLDAGRPPGRAAAARGSASNGVLFVDLDGTVLRTDMLWESLFSAVKQDPRILVKLAPWALGGRARLKRALASRAAPDHDGLPYRADVLDFLRAEKARGRTLVLATAGDALLAQQIADHLELFDDVLASDGRTNLKGSAKLTAIESYCRRHGFGEFAYIGDAEADLAVWSGARDAYVVDPTPRTLASLQRVRGPSRVFGMRRPRTGMVVRALRPGHWLKNILVFVPVLLGHELTNRDKLLAALVMFVAFNACASGGYVLNDLLDVRSDRRHPTKRARPLASGVLPLVAAPVLVAGSLVLGLSLATAVLPRSAVATLALYVALAGLYSFWLKGKVLVDVLTLGGLYTLRIVAGGFATGELVSEWLAAFSLFLFTSLAFAKRHAELRRLAVAGETQAHGRGYQASDLALIESIGPTHGYLAVLVFALYINSDDLKPFYANEWALWLICPLLLYWVSRVWLLARRGLLTEDPVVFAVKDRVSVLVGAVATLLLLIAARGP